jgi:hypothetical protein
MTYNLANMTPSERARMPGNWQELDDVQNLSAVTRVWWRTFEVDEIQPGTFREEVIDATPKLHNVSRPGVAYTTVDGRQVNLELGDIVGVEVGA